MGEAAMTCIIGLKHEGRVYIGADSAGSDGWAVVTRLDRKVFVNSGFVIGGTTSFRMLQLLQHAFRPPKRHADDDLMRYMVTDWIDAVRACLKAGGFAKRENEVESGGTFLVGVAGRLFRIDNDFQVGEPARDFEACGCGEQYARGALQAIIGSEHSPVKRITLALEVAAEHAAGVRGPFHIESIGAAESNPQKGS